MRRISQISLIVGIITAVALAAAGAVAAVNAAGTFEVDGNAVDGHGGGIDWENVYEGSAADTEHQAFAVDNTTSGDLIFTGGGSKDVNDISEWAYSAGTVPDKDDILHSYTAAFSADGDLLLYFGADRFANNGSAQIGIWLFRDNVQLLPDGTFSGTHSDHDLLILSNFTDGGDTSNVQVYRWNGSADDPLTLLAEANVEGAYSVCTEGDLACAFTNASGVKSPWPYTPKSGAAGTFPTVSFFEGGVNLTDLLGAEGLGCYSSFLMETRSSHEATAQLKDLALASFPTCGLEIRKSGDARSAVGNEVTYGFTITNTGLVPLNQQTVIDDVLGDLTQSALDAGCGSLAAGESCQFEVPYTVPTGASDPLTNTVTANYATATGDAVTATDDHQMNLFQPSISFDKSVNAETARVGDELTYTLTLSNTSSVDSPPLTCTLTDPMLGINQTADVVPGGSLSTLGKYTVKASDSSPIVNTATVRCEVQGYTNVLEASDSASVNIAAVNPTAAPSNTPTNTPVPTNTAVPTDTAVPTNTNPPAPTVEGATSTPFPTMAPSSTPLPTLPPTATPTDAPTATAVLIHFPPTNTPKPSSTPRAQATQQSVNPQSPTTVPDPVAPVDSSVKGCSPGFWQGGNGRWLWNDANDPDWKGNGANPYSHNTSFNSFFAPYPSTNGFEMFNFVRGGGGPNDWRKAARNVVAGYLNASYGMNYPYSPAEVKQMWADAVSGSISFMDVHEILGQANTYGCPIDGH